MVDIEKLKKQIVEDLKPLNPKKIILFGSYAYGEPNENSDIDIFILKDDYENRLQEIKKARKLLVDIDMAKDIILTNTHYYQTHSNQNWINTALYEIRKYGEVLYEKR
jgi:predicted nucleotidyltransferase